MCTDIQFDSTKEKVRKLHVMYLLFFKSERTQYLFLQCIKKIKKNHINILFVKVKRKLKNG